MTAYQRRSSIIVYGQLKIGFREVGNENDTQSRRQGNIEAFFHLLWHQRRQQLALSCAGTPAQLVCMILDRHRVNNTKIRECNGQPPLGPINTFSSAVCGRCCLSCIGTVTKRHKLTWDEIRRSTALSIKFTSCIRSIPANCTLHSVD